MSETAKRRFGELLDSILKGQRPGNGQTATAGRRWTYRSFADAVGVDERTVRNWVSGSTSPHDVESVVQALSEGASAPTGLIAELSDIYQRHQSEFDRAKAARSNPPRALPARRQPHGLGPDNGKEISQPTYSYIVRPPRCFGREEDVEDLIAHFKGDNPGPALILGGPGIGKTTVAREVASDSAVSRKYGGRSWFVKLGDADGADDVIVSIALSMGVRDTANSPNTIFDRLRRDSALLVLDNLETVWEADPIRVEKTLQQLASMPGIAVIATLRGNVVPPAPRWAKICSLNALSQAASEKLFREIAHSIESDTPFLADLLKELGGIPLAVELVAYRAAPYSSLDDLWAAWQSFGSEMARRADAVPESAETSLRHSIEISLKSGRLTKDGRTLFSILGQFPAGIALRDRRVIMGDADVSDPRDGTAARPNATGELLSVGLAYQDGDRLLLLPPLRDHAARNYPVERQDAQRAEDHYLSLAATASAKIGTEEGRHGIIRQAAAEISNIEAVVRAAVARRDIDVAKGAVAGLSQIMRAIGRGSESTFDNVAEACRASGDEQGRAECLKYKGDVLIAKGRDLDSAFQAFESARAIFEAIGNSRREAECIQKIGEINLLKLDYEKAKEKLEDAKAKFSLINDRKGEAYCILRLGDTIAKRSGIDVAKREFFPSMDNRGLVAARQHYEKARELFESLCHQRGVANSVQGLAEIAFRQNSDDKDKEAFELFTEALEIFRKFGIDQKEADCLRRLGDIAIHLGTSKTKEQGSEDFFKISEDHYTKAIEIYTRLDFELGVAGCLKGKADVDAERQNFQRARNAYDDALKVYKRLGDLTSIGWLNYFLMGITADDTEKEIYREDARAAWQSAGRHDLLRLLFQ